MPAWLEVQRSKYVFFMIIYNIINDMKYLQNCLHHISAVPQPFLLLIAVDLSLAGFLGRNEAYGLCQHGWRYNRAKRSFY